MAAVISRTEYASSLNPAAVRLRYFPIRPQTGKCLNELRWNSVAVNPKNAFILGSEGALRAPTVNPTVQIPKTRERKRKL